MGSRFRRRLNFLPEITLNVGKTGVSVSAGMRGAKMTIKKSGVRETVGLSSSDLSCSDYRKYGDGHVPSGQQASSNSGYIFSLIAIAVVLFWLITLQFK